MMEGLRASEALEISYGSPGRIFPLTRTALQSSSSSFIHLDWLDSYLVRGSVILTYLQTILFLADHFVATSVLRQPMVWTLHNIEPHNNRGNWLSRYARIRFGGSCRWIRVFSEQTVSRASNHFSIPESRIRVQPEGSFKQYYRDKCRDNLTARVADLQDPTYKILFFGRLSPYKGIERLLEALEPIARSKLVHLTIAGQPVSDNYHRRLAELCQRRDWCTLEAREIPAEEVCVYFDATDFTCLPFKAVENSGSAILAMGFGHPVVAPALGVLPTRLSQQSDLLYAPGELRSTLERITSLPKAELRRIGSLNVKQTEEHDWSNFAAEFLT